MGQNLITGPLALKANMLTTTPWNSTVKNEESYDDITKDYLTFQFSKLNQMVCECITLLISSLCLR